MNQNEKQNLKNALRPYLFVLKEGQQFLKNNLDYSLVMLQLNCKEKIRSPNTSAFVPKRLTIADHIAKRNYTQTT